MVLYSRRSSPQLPLPVWPETPLFSPQRGYLEGRGGVEAGGEMLMIGNMEEKREIERVLERQLRSHEEGLEMLVQEHDVCLRNTEALVLQVLHGALSHGAPINESCHIY